MNDLVPTPDKKHNDEIKRLRLDSDPDSGRRKGRTHLGKLPWDDLYPRLLQAVQRKMGRIVSKRGIQRQNSGAPVEEDVARDVIRKAFERLSSGERLWSRSKSDFQNLWDAVSSEISNSESSVE